MMGAKFNDRSSTSMERNPGPGSYDMQNRDNGNMKNSQKFGIGTSNRTAMVARSISTVPGPGNYDSSLVDKTKGPNYGFGTSVRNDKSGTIAPGPG